MWKWSAFLLCMASLGVGCASTGTSGSQIQATIVDTHKRVAKMENEMNTTLGKISETNAELDARVTSADQQMRRVESISEENQIRLDKLEQRLIEFQTVVYRDIGLAPPGGSRTPPPASPSSQAPSVTIEPPDWRTPPPGESVDITPPPISTSSPAPAPEPMVSTPAPEPVPVAAPVAAPEADPKDAYQKAQRFYADGNYTQARSSFDSFLQTYSSDPEMSANAQFWKAKCDLNLGNYQASIGEFERVVGSFPNSTKVPFAMHNQAVAHSRLGQTDEAVRLLEQVVQGYPSTPAADQARNDLSKLRGQ
jgi:tol-pal system protein YbgF